MDADADLRLAVGQLELLISMGENDSSVTVIRQPFNSQGFYFGNFLQKVVPAPPRAVSRRPFPTIA